MKYLLDTNVVIGLAGGTGNSSLRARAAGCDAGDMATSVIVIAEVAHGSVRGKVPPIEDLATFLEEVPVLSFDERAAFVYADLLFERASYDRLIAAHALSLGLTVITGNVRDFASVPGLVVENWSAG